MDTGDDDSYERYSTHSDDETVNRGLIDITSSTELKDLLNGSDCKSSKNYFGEATSDERNYTKENKKCIRNHLFVIQFAAEWCGLCKSIQPLIGVGY